MTSGDGSIHSLTTAQRDVWRTLLPAQRSVFGSVEFASIAEQQKRGSARLIVYRSQEGRDTIVYPLFLRAISELPIGGSLAAEAWDAGSPEYTGPLALGSISEATGQTFRQCFDRYCQKSRIVTEFAHLYPWRPPSDACWQESVHFDREIVYVDLMRSEEDLWRGSLSRSCRYGIKRARREGVRVFAAETPDQIRQFHEIYVHTMARNQALAKYYYPLQFFMDIFERMPGNARFALAEHAGKVVAGTLFLHDGEDVYSYLAGAYDEYNSVRPTNAVIFDTMRWARDQGKKRLVLGGGYQHDDGVFRFKASFSPLRARFSVYRQVHMSAQYDALCAEWAACQGASPAQGGFFPLYRTESEKVR